MNLIVSILQKNPGATGFLGTVSAISAWDFLRTAQIAAATLAGLVSIMTVIILAPKCFANIRAAWKWAASLFRAR